jgi:hypothetical protein
MPNARTAEIGAVTIADIETKRPRNRLVPIALA